jgi:hypothetical protein
MIDVVSDSHECVTAEGIRYSDYPFPVRALSELYNFDGTLNFDR